MRLGNVIEFRKDLYFEGAVQADWFYDSQKSAKVAENFVFHGKDYHGVEAKKNSIDTISLVTALADKFGKEAANPRSLAIADYGTGKSHLAVTLGVLFSGPQYMPETYKKIINNIKIIDPDAANQVVKLCKDRNFVITLNGIRDFNLHSEILKATQKSLRLYGVDDSELKKLNRTIDTANRFFELNYKSRLHDFEKAASNHNWFESGESLILRLKENIGSDETAFEIINDVYEATTGQRIRWEEGISAKSILEMLLAKYCGLNGQFDHVIILFDEFGRFLEYASGTDGGKCGDNALQEIFEVSQNAAGAMQIINFIQTDIKSYLLRVDQSRNLSRYIGRYDESEKYHISSNLETVFANLISRKDKGTFETIIQKWQSDHEEQWKDIFSKLNKWIQAPGIWADYSKFRKVIVEGTYPIHPISVFMLTKLSDYLQNRSSMTLINQHILNISDHDISASIPLVLPTELMQGDLFVEMLAAETSGRHRSDYCIRFENALKKNEQKLNDDQIAILRANLITRTLRFNTRTYQEAKESLMLCSGLSELAVDDALSILVDEYAVMAFDEMSGCFDFTEDAKGAYDYKIMKQRLLSRQKSDLRNLLGTAAVLDLGSFTQNQETNFGIMHKIQTNEWCFTQDVILAEDMTEEIARKHVEAWKNARSVVTPKGRIVWVYINKDSSLIMEKLHKISALYEDTSIVMMLLNDSDNMLKNILVEYDVLERMDNATKTAYSGIYVKDRERVVENLKNVFDSLKKRREHVTSAEVTGWKKRLPIMLTDIFERIYPEAISYNFDGLLTSSNNFTGNGIKYYCQIMKMLLSNKVNYDTIHDFPIDIRNRIEALFMVGNTSSWKCLNNELVIQSPINEKARNIFNIVESELTSKEIYDCGKFFDRFCAPPYGLSEEAAAMFLSMAMVNMWHTIRVQYRGVRSTVNEWKDYVIEDKKLHLNVFKETTILWVDTSSVEAKFQLLFKKISNNTNIEDAKKLNQELKEAIEFYGLPESLEVYNKVAQMRFDQFVNAERIWDKRVEDVRNELDKAHARGDVYASLTSMEMTQAISIAEIFTTNNIDVSDSYSKELNALLKEADTIITQNFENWLARNVYCKAVDQRSKFERFYIRCCNYLKDYGYHEYARALKEKGEKELYNLAEIKSRQELVYDGRRFVSDAENVSATNYLEIKKLIKTAEELKPRFLKFGEGLGAEALQLAEKVEKISGSLHARKQKMDDDMSSVFDVISEAETVDSLEIAMECLEKVLEYKIADKDREEFLELKKILTSLTEDIDSIISTSSNRTALITIEAKMVNKYGNDEMEYDFMPIIEDGIKMTYEMLNERDFRWRLENVTLHDKSRRAVHEWKQRIQELPLYISESTMEAIQELDVEAEKILSNGRIEDVLLYFKKLSPAEKEKCIELLKNITL